MKEDFLHYIWLHKLFSWVDLKTTQNEEIMIVKSGLHNPNSGPDFLNAQIKIKNILWAGNVEIHVKSSDWYLHNHETDANYDTVVLHVVWEDDVSIFNKNNQQIPTLVLKDLVSEGVLENYHNLYSKSERWIPCEKQIADVDAFLLNNWLERLYFERLEHKSELIENLLKTSKNDYEAVLFQLLAKNFGLKLNGDAFLSLAKSIDFSVIRKERFDELKLSALIFGQSSFLEGEQEEGYHQKLKEEYAYLKHKYNLSSIANEQFQFFRMRPTNFPTVRLAQLVALFAKHQNLFSKLMENQFTDYYMLFSVDVNDFWKTHYTFETVSKKSLKKLTKPFVDLLLINTIIPLQFQYLKSRGEVNIEEFLKLMQQIKQEKNAIITKFSELNIVAKNAFESQALLELKNNYCAKKRCLQCAIGGNLLKCN
jgi:hypothetical protein